MGLHPSKLEEPSTKSSEEIAICTSNCICDNIKQRVVFRPARTVSLHSNFNEPRIIKIPPCLCTTSCPYQQRRNQAADQATLNQLRNSIRNTLQSALDQETEATKKPDSDKVIEDIVPKNYITQVFCCETSYQGSINSDNTEINRSRFEMDINNTRAPEQEQVKSNGTKIYDSNENCKRISPTRHPSGASHGMGRSRRSLQDERSNSIKIYYSNESCKEISAARRPSNVSVGANNTRTTKTEQDENNSIKICDSNENCKKIMNTRRPSNTAQGTSRLSNFFTSVQSACRCSSKNKTIEKPNNDNEHASSIRICQRQEEYGERKLGILYDRRSGSLRQSFDNTSGPYSSFRSDSRSVLLNRRQHPAYYSQPKSNLSISENIKRRENYGEYERQNNFRHSTPSIPTKRSSNILPKRNSFYDDKNILKESKYGQRNEEVRGRQSTHRILPQSHINDNRNSLRRIDYGQENYRSIEHRNINKDEYESQGRRKNSVWNRDLGRENYGQEYRRLDESPIQGYAPTEQRRNLDYDQDYESHNQNRNLGNARKKDSFCQDDYSAHGISKRESEPCFQKRNSALYRNVTRENFLDKEYESRDQNRDLVYDPDLRSYNHEKFDQQQVKVYENPDKLYDTKEQRRNLAYDQDFRRYNQDKARVREVPEKRYEPNDQKKNSAYGQDLRKYNQETFSQAKARVPAKPEKRYEANDKKRNSAYDQDLRRYSHELHDRKRNSEKYYYGKENYVARGGPKKDIELSNQKRSSYDHDIRRDRQIINNQRRNDLQDLKKDNYGAHGNRQNVYNQNRNLENDQVARRDNFRTNERQRDLKNDKDYYTSRFNKNDDKPFNREENSAYNQDLRRDNFQTYDRKRNAESDRYFKSPNKEYYSTSRFNDDEPCNRKRKPAYNIDSERDNYSTENYNPQEFESLENYDEPCYRRRNSVNNRYETYDQNPERENYESTNRNISHSKCSQNKNSVCHKARNENNDHEDYFVQKRNTAGVQDTGKESAETGPQQNDSQSYDQKKNSDYSQDFRKDTYGEEIYGALDHRSSLRNSTESALAGKISNATFQKSHSNLTFIKSPIEIKANQTNHEDCNIATSNRGLTQISVDCCVQTSHVLADHGQKRTPKCHCSNAITQTPNKNCLNEKIQTSQCHCSNVITQTSEKFMCQPKGSQNSHSSRDSGSLAHSTTSNRPYNNNNIDGNLTTSYFNESDCTENGTATSISLSCYCIKNTGAQPMISASQQCCIQVKTQTPTKRVHDVSMKTSVQSLVSATNQTVVVYSSIQICRPQDQERESKLDELNDRRRDRRNKDGLNDRRSSIQICMPKDQERESKLVRSNHNHRNKVKTDDYSSAVVVSPSIKICMPQDQVKENKGGELYDRRRDKRDKDDYGSPVKVSSSIKICMPQDQERESKLGRPNHNRRDKVRTNDNYGTPVEVPSSIQICMPQDQVKGNKVGVLYDRRRDKFKNDDYDSTSQSYISRNSRSHSSFSFQLKSGRKRSREMINSQNQSKGNGARGSCNMRQNYDEKHDRNNDEYDFNDDFNESFEHYFDNDDNEEVLTENEDRGCYCEPQPQTSTRCSQTVDTVKARSPKTHKRDSCTTADYDVRGRFSKTKTCARTSQTDDESYHEPQPQTVDCCSQTVDEVKAKIPKTSKRDSCKPEVYEATDRCAKPETFARTSQTDDECNRGETIESIAPTDIQQGDDESDCNDEKENKPNLMLLQPIVVCYPNPQQTCCSYPCTTTCCDYNCLPYSCDPCCQSICPSLPMPCCTPSTCCSPQICCPPSNCCPQSQPINNCFSIDPNCFNNISYGSQCKKKHKNKSRNCRESSLF